MQRIVPNIWCNETADEATDFYLEVFKEFSPKLENKVTYPTEGLLDFQEPFAGKTLTSEISIDGFHFMLVNAGNEFRPTPAISFFLNVDPNRWDTPRERIDHIWAALKDKGTVRMDLGEYEFSSYYGWIEDPYGVNWQIMLTNPDGERRPTIVPQLMFCGPAQGKAEAARADYLSVFDGTPGNLVHYPAKDEVIFSDFTLYDEWFSAMDSAVEQDFTFSEGVSLMVSAHGQEEIDHLWSHLAHEEQPCGWLRDQYGVSWQIVPDNMGELMAKPGAYEKLMSMTKIIIDEF